jgi:hypothetical protein
MAAMADSILTIQALPVTELMGKLNAIVDAFVAKGEVEVEVDILGVAKALTFHVPLPKAKQ